MTSLVVNVWAELLTEAIGVRVIVDIFPVKAAAVAVSVTSILSAG